MMTKVCGVYCIRHRETLRVYIGSSKNVWARKSSHFYWLVRGKHHCEHLQHSWNKYGEEAFEFFILELCDEDDLLLREQAWMDKAAGRFNSSKVAGRIILTGDKLERRNEAIRAGHAKNGKRTLTEEHKKKLSVAHKGKKKPPRGASYTEKLKARLKMDDYLHSPAAVAKRLATMAGRGWSEKRKEADARRKATGIKVPWSQKRREADNRRKEMGNANQHGSGEHSKDV